jgi:NTE family protein
MTEKRDGNKGNSPYGPQNGIPGIGIALGGGMARGFSHIGVLRTLNKHGIFPSIVAGTSIGAVVGASYLAGKLDVFQDWSMNLNRMKILSYLDFRVRSAGLIGGKRLMATLHQHFKDMNVEDLPHPFITIAADLVTGHEVWIRKGNLIEAITASFALPGVFPPVERNKRFLIDGALVNPCPVSACQAMGARMTIAVDLHADLIGKATKPGQNYQTVAGFDLFDEKDVPKEEQDKLSNALTRRLFKREDSSPSLFGVMISSLGIIQDRLTRSRMAGDPPDVHIKPHIGHIGLLEFEKAQELIAAGEAAALRAMPEIRAAMDVLLPADTFQK